ncbi:MAG: membrane protein insertion efficiency factor YidD [Synergistaceae bacterium]|jgi:putative membrane protein insertion efficiency factor|nr:membrane protein insertion efficiency factor YidD [Synergistaceae bacterium]
MNFPVRLSVCLIRGYQKWVSPLLGNRCRFYPSCSQYALLAMTEWGFFRGLRLSARRLAKCGPWHEGGYDPVPLKNNIRAQGGGARSPKSGLTSPPEIP